MPTAHVASGNLSVEQEAELAEKATKPCILFPDGLHCFYIVQRQTRVFLKLAKYCPCGAMVSTKRYDYDAFMDGIVPRLIEVDEQGKPIEPTEPS